MDPAEGAATNVAPNTALREQARTAWIMGLAAVMLAMVAPCSSYVTLLAALPLGFIATSSARRILAEADLDAPGQVYAQTAMVTGIASAAWSGFIIVMGLGLVLLYAGLIFSVIGLNL